MSEMDILAFEFTYPGNDGKYFCKVIDMFTHYFTKKTMRYIRIDFVNDEEASTYFDILDEDEYQELVSLRIPRGGVDEG